MAGTVGDLLESEGIEVSEHDVVAPAWPPSSTTARRSRSGTAAEVTVNVDGTAADHLDHRDHGRPGAGPPWPSTPTGAELSTSRSAPIGREGLDLDIATAEDRS